MIDSAPGPAYIRPELNSGANAAKSNTYKPPDSNDTCSITSCLDSTNIIEIARCEAKSPRPPAAPALRPVVSRRRISRWRADEDPGREPSSVMLSAHGYHLQECIDGPLRWG